ncbi:MAG: valine--tRNA ligase [Deltaproteobacteria bacterium]|nr:valine--tRNA ligase [Deltaproteobacteria bacterium]
MQLPDYNPAQIELKWQKFWEEKGYFKATTSSKKKSYCIALPPPNVTGSLHMGHALYVIQDALIRWKRMQGFNTLWIPGIDHAGIATQNVVEKELASDGKSRHDLGRVEFLKRVEKWKDKHGSRILEQLRYLGFSLDWSRLSYTMDEIFSKAVVEVFVRLYKEKLIYRGHRLINWCPRCRTALSDLEVEHEERKSKLWHLKYPLKANTFQYITVATTRPETMLGDTAVAVHPRDPRYKKLIGTKIILPLMQREIPIIADEKVERDFGSGAVKVTPAHDFNDFEMGLRHGLQQISIFNDAACLNENAGPYQGLTREECRLKVLEELKSKNLLEKEEDHLLNISLCQRCQSVVEPHLSTQWFVSMKPLAKLAREAVKLRKIKIIPSHWDKTFFHWVENIQDWCISRQLWWGHRIPAWYCDDCNSVTVATSIPTQCFHCKCEKLSQDPDVLDTWFSSALWPFATLGWPQKTKELKVFYPNSVLETGHDILFFWVARMIMMGLKFMKKVPFAYVYLHPLILDKEGRKMSKSSGNVIDPLDVTKDYGADALRFALLSLTSHARSIRLSLEEVGGYRNFMNKIWNAAKLSLNFLDSMSLRVPKGRGNSNVRFFGLCPLNDGSDLSLIHRWILTRLHQTIHSVQKAFEEFRFGDSAHELYQFIWYEFCDWYLEFLKPVFYGTDEEAKMESRVVLDHVLRNILKLLHPFVPHISEELWHSVPGNKMPLIVEPFPKAQKKLLFSSSLRDMEVLKSAILAVRNIRGENNISPSTKLNIVLVCSKKRRHFLKCHLKEFEFLARVAGTIFEKNQDFKKRKLYAQAHFLGTDLFVSLEGLVNIEEERLRLAKSLEKVDQELMQINSRLNNESFVSKAPKRIVDEHKQKAEELMSKKEKLTAALEKLKVSVLSS